jgi:Lon protease-like protein
MILENNDIMEAFNGYAPIFSISDFVMFPSTTYNFNIYESKYRKMVEDISKENKLFSIHMKTDLLESGVCEIGTLCQIIESKHLDNGNYDIIVTGVKKVRINKSVDSKNSYNVASLELIPENSVIHQEKLKRKKLINKFLSLVSNGEDNLNLNLIDTSMISTEMLTNLASLILPLDKEDKQKLLELDEIGVRLEVLCQFLDSELKVENDLVNFKQIIPTNINWN